MTRFVLSLLANSNVITQYTKNPVAILTDRWIATLQAKQLQVNCRVLITLNLSDQHRGAPRSQVGSHSTGSDMLQ